MKSVFLLFVRIQNYRFKMAFHSQIIPSFKKKLLRNYARALSIEARLFIRAQHVSEHQQNSNRSKLRCIAFQRMKISKKLLCNF